MTIADLPIGARPAPVASHTERVLLTAELAEHRRARRWRLSIWIGRLLLFGCVVGFWQFAPPSILDPEFASRPSLVVKAWLAMAATGAFWSDTGLTFLEFILGYASGAVLAVGCAVLLMLGRLSYRVSEPFLIVLAGLPIVSVGPILVLWFGNGMGIKVTLAALATFALVLLNSVSGIRSASPGVVNSLKVLGATRFAIYTRYILPAALPYTLTALKLSISTAIVGVVLGEFLSSEKGLGRAILDHATYMDIDKMIASVATLSLFVMILRGVLAPFERWADRHQRAHNS